MVRSLGASAGQAATARHGGRPVALGVLVAVLFLTFLDNTIVSVALGSVQSDLHAGGSTASRSRPALKDLWPDNAATCWQSAFTQLGKSQDESPLF